MQNWRNYLFSDDPFTAKVQKVFGYQYENNAVYRRFFEALYHKKENFRTKNILKQLREDHYQIPLLPIRAFKDASVSCHPQEDHDLLFRSSGTGGMARSEHKVKNEALYRRAIMDGFKHFYNLDNAVILGYTPGYAANPHSSLIWMIKELISCDEIKKSRFLPLGEPLSQGEVHDIAASGRQLILFGAAFGLMDLVEISSVELPSNSIVIETGGMKTHRREMSRKDMHRKLADGFNIDVSRIHSEYGMCELLSQAYAIGGNWFRCPPWMQVSIRNPDNPQQLLPPFREGLIGIIDLANVHSCAFLLSGDRGVMDERGRFKVLGRWHETDLRGCNFLIDED